MNAPAPPAKITELDGLRAVSVLFVMLVHASYGRLSGGFLGVDIFFVISGYLITYLLISEREATGRISLVDFYMRRVFRILPPLICAIVLAMLLWQGEGGARGPVVAAALFFYANFLPAETLGNLGHTWSLAIEEQFYLVWPLLFTLIFARSRALLMAIAVAIIIGSITVRAYLVTRWSDLNPLYTFTPARLDPIMLGCLLALGQGWAERVLRLAPPLVLRVTAWLSAAALIGALVFAQRDFMQSTPIAFFLFALTGASLVVSAPMLPSRDWLRRALNTPLMRYIGKRSYGLYLYHYPIFGALEAWRVEGDLGNYIVVTLVKIALSFAVTELSWRIVEQPALRLKARFSWVKSRAPPAPHTAGQ
ncbi:MAG: acyltransferase [Sphingopyxis sp.]